MSPLTETRRLWDKLSDTAKVITTIVTMLTAIVSVVYAAETHFVNQKEIAQTLDMFDLKQQRSFERIELRILQDNLSDLERRYYEKKALLRAYPNDQEIIDELEYIKTERRNVKVEIKKMLIREPKLKE
jgi:hypothetical protein